MLRISENQGYVNIAQLFQCSHLNRRNCCFAVQLNIPVELRVIFLAFRGLLGGHSVAIMLKEKGEYMQWYNGELLHMAKELGYKLLPAFNTTSGLPYPRVSSVLSAIQIYFCKQKLWLFWFCLDF